MVSANLQNYGMLIVDDDEFMRGFLVRILSGLGAIDISTASNGTQAIRCLDSCPRGPDIILCDLNMPEMDGIEFLRHLVEQRFRGGIVLISGADPRVIRSAEILAEARNLNVLGTLMKPVKPEILEKALQAYRAGPR